MRIVVTPSATRRTGRLPRKSAQQPRLRQGCRPPTQRSVHRARPRARPGGQRIVLALVRWIKLVDDPCVHDRGEAIENLRPEVRGRLVALHAEAGGPGCGLVSADAFKASTGWGQLDHRRYQGRNGDGEEEVQDRNPEPESAPHPRQRAVVVVGMPAEYQHRAEKQGVRPERRDDRVGDRVRLIKNPFTRPAAMAARNAMPIASNAYCSRRGTWSRCSDVRGEPARYGEVDPALHDDQRLAAPRSPAQTRRAASSGRRPCSGWRMRTANWRRTAAPSQPARLRNRVTRTCSTRVRWSLSTAPNCPLRDSRLAWRRMLTSRASVHKYQVNTRVVFSENEHTAGEQYGDRREDGGAMGRVPRQGRGGQGGAGGIGSAACRAIAAEGERSLSPISMPPPPSPLRPRSRPTAVCDICRRRRYRSVPGAGDGADHSRGVRRAERHLQQRRHESAAEFHGGRRSELRRDRPREYLGCDPLHPGGRAPNDRAGIRRQDHQHRSIASRQGYWEFVPYCVAKFGTLAVTQATARGLIEHGITGRHLRAGVVDTPMWIRLTNIGDDGRRRRGSDDGIRHQHVDRQAGRTSRIGAFPRIFGVCRVRLHDRTDVHGRRRTDPCLIALEHTRLISNPRRSDESTPSRRHHGQGSRRVDPLLPRRSRTSVRRSQPVADGEELSRGVVCPAPPCAR